MRASSRRGHVCSLPIKDTTGLPKLPPNASNLKKFVRNVRKLFLLNPNNYKCKKMFRNKASLIAEKKRHAKGPYSWVFHPMSLLSSYIDGLFCITWMYCLTADPLLVYGDDFTLFFRVMQQKIVFTIKLVVIVYFFNVGYIDHKTKTCIVERKKIIKRYLMGYFFFDICSSYCTILFANLLTYFEVAKCSIEYAGESSCYGYFYFYRLICCAIRIPSLFAMVDECLANLGINEQIRLVFIYVVRTFFILHLFSFMMYFVPLMEYQGNWPNGTWLYEAKIVHNEGYRHQFGQCFLIVVCAFFAISYRFDMNMLDERICIAVVTLFGRIYTLYLLADILTVFGIAGVSESMYERQLLALKTYMLEKDLPESLRQRMLRYYEFKFQKRYFREGMILATLSEHLRNDLFLYTARKLVQKVEFFKKLPNITLGAIIAEMKSEIFSSNDIIIRVGDVVENIYFISSGTVAVTNSDGIELYHLEDGDEFGSSCIVMKRIIFSVVAVETTEVFSISRDSFLEFLEPHSDVMFAFHRSIKQKLLRLKNIEDLASKTTKNFIDELPNVVERASRRFVTF